MKRTMLVLALITAGTSFLGACNKDLKNDVKSLQSQSDSLLKSGLDLQKKLQKLNDAVGSSEPMTVTTTFQDNSNTTRTIQGTYKYRSNTFWTQSLMKTETGAYHISVARAAVLSYAEMAEVSFLYDPATKKISQMAGRHVWQDRDPYRDEFYFDAPQGTPGLSIQIDLLKIDLNTGEVAFTCTSTATPQYANYDGPWRMPNESKNVKTIISFAGKLQHIN